MRAILLLTVVAALSACSSIKDYELRMHGSSRLNLNDENQPNSVELKVLRLKGAEPEAAFKRAKLEELWNMQITDKGLEIHGGQQSLFVPASDEPVILKLEQVPPEVTHVGIVGNFNRATKEDRVVLSRDELGTAELWLYDHVIAKKPPPAPEPTAPAKQGP